MHYPLFLNGWELRDCDSLLYHRKENNKHHFIDLVWLDSCIGDPGYNESGDCYVVVENIEDENNYDNAENNFIDLHHTDEFAISKIVTRSEAEKMILDFVKNN